MRIVIPAEYQAPFSFWPDPVFRRALSASGSLGFVILLIILLAPERRIVVTQVEQMPERLARLIVKPKPATPPAVAARVPAPAPLTSDRTWHVPAPRPAPVAETATQSAEPAGEGIANARPGRRGAPGSPNDHGPGTPVKGPGDGGDYGKAGAAAAQKAFGAAGLGDLTASVDQSLNTIAHSIKSEGGQGTGVPGEPAPNPNGKAGLLPGPSGGLPPAEAKHYSLSARGTADVERMGSGGGIGGGTGAGGGGVSLVSIGNVRAVGGGGAGGGSGTGLGDALAGLGGGGGGGGDGLGVGGRRRGGAGGDGGGGGGAPGGGGGNGGRSNASILATIRRYAAGIEFCYDSELKREPALRGKLIVSIKLAASGEVLDARIVKDTLGSEHLKQCILAQVREWKFASVPGGEAEFQAPFVFTPPVK